MRSRPADPDPVELDAGTIVAIAVVAWAVTTLLHEGLGHGGACVLVGGVPRLVTSAYFDYDEGSVSAAAVRVISAGGTLVNLAVGIPLSLVARLVIAPRLRLVVWLLAAFNLTTGFGYFLYSGIGGIGDWRVVIAGLPSEGAWRIAEIVAGAFGYFVLAPRLLWPAILPLIGGGSDRVRRARMLTLVPYLVAGGLALASGALNPLGMEIMLISSAAAAFGGTSLLAWYFAMLADKRPDASAAGIGIPRSIKWWVAAALAVAVFVGVFGPGLTL